MATVSATLRIYCDDHRHPGGGAVTVKIFKRVHLADGSHKWIGLYRRGAPADAAAVVRVGDRDVVASEARGPVEIRKNDPDLIYAYRPGTNDPWVNDDEFDSLRHVLEWECKKCAKRTRDGVKIAIRQERLTILLDQVMNGRTGRADITLRELAATAGSMRGTEA